MLNCKEATELVLKSEEENIGLKNRMNLWFHLMMCSLCKLFAIQSMQITKAAKLIQHNETISLSNNDKKTIVEKLENS